MVENNMTPDMTGWSRFAYVCDGEVADIAHIPPVAERMIAVLSSNPIVIPISEGQDVAIGDNYSNGVFNKPQAS